MSSCCLYSPLFVQPTEPLFTEIGSRFIQEVGPPKLFVVSFLFCLDSNTKIFLKMISEFGTDHVYNCDVFNEVKPTQSDPTFVSMVGSAVFNAMTITDPDAIW